LTTPLEPPALDLFGALDPVKAWVEEVELPSRLAAEFG